MEETPEAKTVEVKGEAVEGAAGEALEEVPWQEAVPVAVDSRTSGEGRSRCSSRDDNVPTFQTPLKTNTTTIDN